MMRGDTARDERDALTGDRRRDRHRRREADLARLPQPRQEEPQRVRDIRRSRREAAPPHVRRPPAPLGDGSRRSEPGRSRCCVSFALAHVSAPRPTGPGSGRHRGCSELWPGPERSRCASISSPYRTLRSSNVPTTNAAAETSEPSTRKIISVSASFLRWGSGAQRLLGVCRRSEGAVRRQSSV